MRIIQAVIQVPASQCDEKRCVILERTSDGAPDYFRFRIILRELRNQNVKCVSDSAALIMDHVVVATYRCPNEALTWKSRIHDGISRVPLLAGFREPTVVGTKCDDCRWQIARGTNLMEARGILEHAAIFRRKFCYIRVAQALHRDTEK